MTIRFDENFSVSAADLWAIIGTVDRVDWVPGVTHCVFDGRVRRLQLPGAGDIAEEIVIRDEGSMRLVYRCIESPQPMEFHEARVSIEALSETECRFVWEADIKPAAFVPFLRGSMQGALEQLRVVAAQST
ncbi:MAG: SRPBCC family protein [Pseudomonadales bacterium]|jgi:predicted neuraminidase